MLSNNALYYDAQLAAQVGFTRAGALGARKRGR